MCNVVQMILQRYMDPVWLENSFPSWVQKCNDAVNAESIELLKEVMVSPEADSIIDMYVSDVVSYEVHFICFV